MLRDVLVATPEPSDEALHALWIDSVLARMDARPMGDAQSSRQARIRQACAIPFRHDGDEIVFCLITSLKMKRWIFPKGIVDPGENEEETAIREALEEAGLHGHVVGEPLGRYEDSKRDATVDVTVFLMQVERCEDIWEEADLRDRCWVGPAEALQLVAKPDRKQMLSRAIEQIRGTAARCLGGTKNCS